MIEALASRLEFEYRDITVKIPLVRTSMELRKAVQISLGPALQERRGYAWTHFDLGMIPYNYYVDSMFFRSPEGMAQLLQLLSERYGRRIPQTIGTIRVAAIVPQRSHLIGYMKERPERGQKLEVFMGETFILGTVMVDDDIEVPPLGLSILDDTSTLELWTKNAVAIDGDALIADHDIPEGDIISNATVLRILEDIFAPYKI